MMVWFCGIAKEIHDERNKIKIELRASFPTLEGYFTLLIIFDSSEDGYGIRIWKLLFIYRSISYLVPLPLAYPIFRKKRYPSA